MLLALKRILLADPVPVLREPAKVVLLLKKDNQVSVFIEDKRHKTKVLLVFFSFLLSPFSFLLVFTFSFLLHFRFALRPTPYALCPMPSALCPLPYALCPTPYALCPMLFVASLGP